LKRALLVLATIGGCSLGLDASKLDAQGDSGASLDDGGSPPIDAPTTENAAPEASPPADAGACTKDADCLATNGCLSGRCDTSTGACVFDVCKQAALCTRAACDTSGGTCGPPSTYGFHASAFKVTQGAVGCNGNPGYCFAAVYPYLFVGTTNGLVAYAAVDPANASPTPLPIAGLPFPPSFVVASGPRVWIAGATFGAGPTCKLPLAWIDVPTSPFEQALHAQSVLVDTQCSLSYLFARAGGGAFLVAGDAPSAFPTAIADAPVADLTPLSVASNNGITSGASPAAASGTRLVMSRWVSVAEQYAGVFAFVDGAGTKGEQAGAEQNTVGAMGQVYGGGVIAESRGGGLVWGAPLIAPNPPAGFTTVAARVAFLANNAKDTAFDATAHADVETYSPGSVGFGANVVGPIASLDESHVLALAQVPASLATTSVQIVERAEGDAGAQATVVAGKRFVLPIGNDKLAATSTNGFGYVLANDAVDSATVHVFAPACP
jgi:hypothetical protein